MSNLLAASAAFVFLHLFPSMPWRQRAIRALGEGAYMVVFSLISAAALLWLLWAFWDAEPGERLWTAPEIWFWVKPAIILFAFLLMVGATTTPNPSAVGRGKALDRADLAKGIMAITRHPLMWGIGLWAIAHLISQGTVRALLFFGSFALVALVGAWLQERRKRKELGDAWARFESHTSYWPFAALLQGRTRLSFRALGWWRIVLTVALWAAFFHFHAWLFGASPLPV